MRRVRVSFAKEQAVGGDAMRWQDDLPRHDVVTIPVVWLAFVLSLLVHVAALILAWPHVKPLLIDAISPGQPGALAVEIAPRASALPNTAPAAPPPAPSIASRPSPVPAPAPRPRPPRAVARSTPPSTPPVVAIERPVPSAPQLPQPAPSPPVSAPPAAEQPRPSQQPLETDLASYVEARRRARGESSAASAGNSSDAPPAESEAERRNRIIAANLGLNRTPTFGRDPNNAGGLFQVREVNYDDAVFYFYGMDRDINRTAQQKIEVRRGSNPDIRIAIVRKMIEIIRENVSGDFVWSSQRLGRDVRMSARPADNAELEAFILHDIFPDARAP
jgi:hypothetical protein